MHQPRAHFCNVLDVNKVPGLVAIGYAIAVGTKQVHRTRIPHLVEGVKDD